MASSGPEYTMNLAALQQRDPYITDIVDTASQVALYSFNAKQQEWVSQRHCYISFFNTVGRCFPIIPVWADLADM